MAIGVLILGESGSGKSYSMRNFNENEVKVISVEKPILPFKNHFDITRTNDVKKIIQELKSTNKKIAVIDDFQYILGLAAMRRSLEKGWDKFSEMQFDYFQILDVLKELPDDMIVYFLSHTETDENGVTKIKTIGKALDKYITIEGLFMIVLGTRVSDGNYYFITQTNGKDTLKTPAGMFPSYAVDNDLKYVDEKIRNYYEIGEFLSDDDMREIDEAAKKDDIPIADGKKGRRRAKKEEPANTSEEKEKEETAKPDTEQVVSTEDSDKEAVQEQTVKRTRKKREPVEESFRGEDESNDSGAVEVPGEKKTRTRSRKQQAHDAAEEQIMNDMPAEDEDTEEEFDATPTPIETTGRRRRRRKED